MAIQLFLDRQNKSHLMNEQKRTELDPRPHIPYHTRSPLSFDGGRRGGLPHHMASSNSPGFNCPTLLSFVP
jgi:hypothetical protein